MAEIKFACPECKQRIAVDTAAAGMAIDCPRCASSLVIPASLDVPVNVLKRRRLAVLAGSQEDRAFDELEQKQRELEKAVSESTKLRNEVESSRQELIKFRQELATVVPTREGFHIVESPDTELKAEVETIRAQVVDALRAREKSSSEISSEQAQLIQAQSELTRLSAETTGYKARITTLETGLAEAQAARMRQVEENSSLVTQLRADLELNTDAAKTAEAKYTALNAEIEAIKAKSVKDTTDAETARLDLEKQRQLNSEMSARLAGLESELGNLHQQLSNKGLEVGDRLKKVDAERNAALIEVEELRAELARLNIAHESELKNHQEADAEIARLIEQTGKAQADFELQKQTGRKIHEQLTAERDKLREQIAAGTAESKKLREQVEVLSAAINDSTSAADIASKDRERLNEEIAAMRDQLARLTVERDSLQINSANAIRENEQARTELDGLRSQLTEESRRVDDLNARLTESEQARTELQKKADDPTTSENLKETRKRCKQIEEQLQETMRLVESIRTARDNAVAQLAQRDEALEKASLTMEGAKAELDRLRSQLADAVVERDTLKVAISEAEEEVRELKERVDGLLDDLHAREGEVARLRQQLETDQAERAELSTRLQKNERASADAWAQLDTAKKDAAAQLEATKKAEAAHTALQAQFEKVNAEANAQKGSVTELTGKLKTAETALEDARKKLKAAQSDYEKAVAEAAARDKQTQETSTRLTAEAAAAKARAEELARRAQSLETDLEQTKQKLTAAEGKVQSDEAELGRLRSQSETASRNLAVLQEKFHALEADRDRLAADNKRISSESGNSGEAIKQARLDRDASRTALADMERQLEQSLDQLHAIEEEHGQLKEELDATKVGLERAKQHVTVLQSRRDQMRDEIARLKVKLGLAPDAVV